MTPQEKQNISKLLKKMFPPVSGLNLCNHMISNSMRISLKILISEINRKRFINKDWLLKKLHSSLYLSKNDKEECNQRSIDYKNALNSYLIDVNIIFQH
jgi:hypothetical protein